MKPLKPVIGKKEISVLVTGVGCTTGQSIIKALKLSQLPLRIICVDANVLSAGLYTSDKSYLVPLAKEKGFLPRIIEICNKESIKLILIGSTPEVSYYAKYKHKIEKETSAKVVVSSDKMVGTCQDKYLTYRFLKDRNFLFPETQLVGEKEDCVKFAKKVGYPIILKARIGCAAKEVWKISNEEELVRMIKGKGQSYILQEYLHPKEEEYTCGVYFDHNRIFKGSIAMRRELYLGETYRGETDDFPHINEYAKKVGMALGVVGPANMQLVLTAKGPTIFEINPRFSSSTSMRAYLGFNDVEYAVRNFVLNEKTPPLQYKNAIALRYVNEVFIEKESMYELQKKKELSHPKAKQCSGL